VRSSGASQATAGSIPHSRSRLSSIDGCLGSSFSISPNTRSAGSSPWHGGAQARGRRIDGICARRQLNGPQRASGPRRTWPIHRAQHARLEVGAPVVGIEHLAREGVLQQRVHGEIAAAPASANVSADRRSRRCHDAGPALESQGAATRRRRFTPASPAI
jgi:hypothetical protein